MRRGKKGPFVKRKAERSRPVKIVPGPGRYFVLMPNGTELAWFEEFSGYGGAKEYLDVRAADLPTGTEVVRRCDGVVMSYLSKSKTFGTTP